VTSDSRERLRAHLVEDEGVRFKPYTDTVGKLTIGIGRNLTDVGITANEALFLLENDIDRAVKDLVARFPWVTKLDDVRLVALVNLCFNMGGATLAKFVNTMAAIERGNWEAAAAGLRASLWFRQVQRSRSTRIIAMIKTGRWPDEAAV
jgi:lysozyme